MTTLTTLNVSREQIEQDLAAGKSVEEIAQDWSEPRANVYAVKRAMDATASASSAPTPLHVAPAPVPATADAGLTALVLEASQSKSPRTRALGAKLDKLVEALQARLTTEQAEAAAAEAKRREREAAAAEVASLEEQLRAARAKLGGKTPARTSPQKAPDAGPTASDIREWAASAGVDCPTRGMPPKRVVDAYRAAHDGDGAA